MNADGLRAAAWWLLAAVFVCATVFLGVGALAGLSTLAYPVVAGIEPGGTPDARQLAGMWFDSSCWIPMLVLATIVTVLVFPDGPLSRRWRPALWVAAVTTGALSLWLSLWPTLSASRSRTHGFGWTHTPARDGRAVAARGGAVTGRSAVPLAARGSVRASGLVYPR